MICAFHVRHKFMPGQDGPKERCLKVPGFVVVIIWCKMIETVVVKKVVSMIW